MYAFLLNPKADIYYFCKKNRNKANIPAKKSVMFGRNRYLCDVRREKSPADKESVYRFRPKEQKSPKKNQKDERT